MKILLLIVLIVTLARPAMAQNDSATVATTIVHAGVELDAARSTNGASRATIRSAEVAYAVARALLDGRDYVGARTLAQTALRLARDAEHGGVEVEITPVERCEAPTPSGCR